MNIVAIIGLIAVLGCGETKQSTTKKEPVSEPQKEVIEENITQLNPILGSWRWEKTICCGRIRNEIKDTAGYDLIYQFKMGNVLNIFHGAEFVEGKEYTVIEDALKSPQNPRKGIQLEGSPYSGLLSFRGPSMDTMVIDYGYMDLQTETWVRVK